MGEGSAREDGLAPRARGLARASRGPLARHGAQAADALHRALVAQTTAQRVGRGRGIGDHRPGAQAFADVFGPLGMPVEVVSDRPGDAATLKLLRSVFTKGLAASVLESLSAAAAAGHAAWLRGEIASVLGEPLLERLVEGSKRHAARRVDEMEAACELLLELGVEPRVDIVGAALLLLLGSIAAGLFVGRDGRLHEGHAVVAMTIRDDGRVGDAVALEASHQAFAEAVLEVAAGIEHGDRLALFHERRGGGHAGRT